MLTSSMCGPAILYIGFSLIQIIIDLYKNLFSSAFIKMIVMLILALTINVLCEMGLHVIAWFLVFIPIIMMTIISTLLLKTFGTDPSSKYLKSKVVNENDINKKSPILSEEDNYERIDRDKKRKLFYDKIEEVYDLSSNKEDLYDLSNNKEKYFISNLFLNNFFIDSINNLSNRFKNFGSNMINPLNSYNSLNYNSPHINSLPITSSFEIRPDNMNGTDFESYEKLYNDNYKLDGKSIFDFENRRKMEIKYPNYTKEQIDIQIEDKWNKLSAAEQNAYNKTGLTNENKSNYNPYDLSRYRSPLIQMNYNNKKYTQSYEPCPPGKERNSLNMCVLPCPIGEERIMGIGCKTICNNNQKRQSDGTCI
jgi:hypothetical protein